MEGTCAHPISTHELALIVAIMIVASYIYDYRSMLGIESMAANLIELLLKVIGSVI